ncbi:hypothetical protein D3C72_1718700 [compost metagenome]
MDSDGFFTSNRYMSWTMRPSSRMRPLAAKKSLMGMDFICFITAAGSSVPAACTAFR